MKHRIILLVFSSCILILAGSLSSVGNVVSPSEDSQEQKRISRASVDTPGSFRSSWYSRYKNEIILNIHEITSLAGGEIFLGGSYYANASTMHTVLLVSQDGGHTWKDAGIKFSGSGVKNFQTFGLNHVWAISTYLTEGCNSPEDLLYSTDAGKSWSAVSLNFIEQMQPLEWIQYFQFFDNLRGLLIISGSMYVDRIYTTFDGGKTWKKIMTSHNNPHIEPDFPNYSRQNTNKAALWRHGSPSEDYRISGFIRIRKADSYKDPYIVIESQGFGGKEWKQISQIPRYYKIEKDSVVPVDSSKSED